MAVAVASKVRVVPIEDGDAARAAEFLYANMDSGPPASGWERAIATAWDPRRPNAGFMLLDGETVAGVQLAFYSRRALPGGEEVAICNLGAWCVLPSHRLHSLKLPRAVLAQEGWAFTDLSPSGNVVALNERMGFTHLDTTTSLVPALPWWSPRVRAITDPEAIERALTGRQLEIFRDHRDAPAAHHVLLRRGADARYLIFRKDRRRDLPLFASVLHAGDPALPAWAWRAFGAHVLRRHGVLAVLAEHRVAGRPPRPSALLGEARPKMVRGAQLPPDRVDYLYSELVSVPW